ncbi:MAG: hypothetical protein M1831_000073 [Alyxoria varia]|nr:MAG: hypothetical protein M1831_000073 [Alyxoria varia]
MPSRYCWNAFEVLDLHPDTLDTRCVGYAKSQGRRCRNPIAGHNLDAAWGEMQTLGKRHPRSHEARDLVRFLASRMLCRRWHQDQASSVASSWIRELNNLESSQYRVSLPQQPPADWTVASSTTTSSIADDALEISAEEHTQPEPYRQPRPIAGSHGLSNARSQVALSNQSTQPRLANVASAIPAQIEEASALSSGNVTRHADDVAVAIRTTSPTNQTIHAPAPQRTLAAAQPIESTIRRAHHEQQDEPHTTGAYNRQTYQTSDTRNGNQRPFTFGSASGTTPTQFPGLDTVEDQRGPSSSATPPVRDVLEAWTSFTSNLADSNSSAESDSQTPTMAARSQSQQLPEPTFSLSGLSLLSNAAEYSASSPTATVPTILENYTGEESDEESDEETGILESLSRLFGNNDEATTAPGPHTLSATTLPSPDPQGNVIQTVEVYSDESPTPPPASSTQQRFLELTPTPPRTTSTNARFLELTPTPPAPATREATVSPSPSSVASTSTLSGTPRSPTRSATPPPASSLITVYSATLPGLSNPPTGTRTCNLRHAHRQPLPSICSICYDPMLLCSSTTFSSSSSDSKLTFCKTSCGHNFHQECIDRWSGSADPNSSPQTRRQANDRNATPCPYCRTPMGEPCAHDEQAPPVGPTRITQREDLNSVSLAEVWDALPEGVREQLVWGGGNVEEE